MGINFESKPFYGNNGDKHIKAKTKIFKDSIITNFRNEKVPEEKVSYKFLSAIILDSVLKVCGKYHFQKFLEECKYKLLLQQQQQQQQQQQNNYIDEDFKSDATLMMK